MKILNALSETKGYNTIIKSHDAFFTFTLLFKKNIYTSFFKKNSNEMKYISVKEFNLANDHLYVQFYQSMS